MGEVSGRRKPRSIHATSCSLDAHRDVASPRRAHASSSLTGSPCGKPSQREEAPDRRKVERAETLREGDREGGRLVDSHCDEAGRECGFGRPDPSGHGNQTRQDGGRCVDEDELWQGEVDAVGETGRPQGKGIEQLGGDGSPKTPIRLRRLRATTQRLESVLRTPGMTFARTFGRARTVTAVTTSADRDTDEEASIGSRALELAGVDLHSHEWERHQEERRLDDRVGCVIDCSPGDGFGPGAPIRCRQRRLVAIRPAELGTVRLMNLSADWSAIKGSSGSGVGTPPRAETADGTNVVWARSSATITHAASALRSSSAIVSNPISASWLISRYAAKITAAMTTMSRGADAEKRRDLRLLYAGRGRDRGAEILEVHLMCAREVSEMRCQRCALEVRQHASYYVAPSARDSHA